MEKSVRVNCGLVNLGNTCFMNTILQCLLQSPSLVKYLESQEFSGDLIEQHTCFPFTKEFRILSEAMKKSNRPIAPNSFKRMADHRMLQKQQDGLMIGQHNDAHEFLEMMFDTIHESISYIPKIKIEIQHPERLSSFDKLTLQACQRWKTHFKSGYSKIVELFNGQFISETRNNQKISHCFDPFGVLTLEIPRDIKEPSLIECLEKFMSPEEIKDDSNGNIIHRKFEFWKLPNNLIITLKRFDYFMGNQKNETRVHYPSELDLTDYCQTAGENDCRYRLYGICCHKGNHGSFGHYNAVCRPWGQNYWYLYDDQSVRKINRACEVPLTNSAYILFYHRIS